MDTVPVVLLDSVVVKAFEQNKGWAEVPAAVNFIGRTTLERFGAASVVAAINTTPGLRMEERSPGSYRFNIRGSSLRSPFGVRNVKVYYNDIPFTDPGGQTYLNNLGYYNYASVEIIKGPGSSLYGAGTGGVLLIDGIDKRGAKGFTAEYTRGSFGLHQIYGALSFGKEDDHHSISYQRQQSNGYRQHSRLQRDVISWHGQYKIATKGELRTTVLFSDLFYQTPGALNLNEFTNDPKGSRPAGGGFPSAAAAQAAIYQKMFLAGVSYNQPIAENLWNKTVAYGTFTQLNNPAIRNYGVVNEPHAGTRTLFTYDKMYGANQLKLNAGAEWQQGFSSAAIYKNRGGNRDTLQIEDDITNRQAFVFVQAALDLSRWAFTAGASVNSMKVTFQRFQPAPLPKGIKTFNNEVAPRFSLMRKGKRINIYTSVAKGFSPPTTTELLPTGSAINTSLNAEDGWNYDVGLKGYLLGNLSFDINAFLFSLQNTIVQRRDAGGGELFINAGKTRQRGIESSFNHPLLFSNFFNRGTIWASYTYHHFTYADFKQLANDYSGNRLPGVAPHTVAAGYDFLHRSGINGALTYFYSDALPLNDANTAYADGYHLLGIKLGWQQKVKQKFLLKWQIGAENLLNETYSLGNDVNGFGGRYYNAAAGRSYYTSLLFQWQ